MHPRLSMVRPEMQMVASAGNLHRPSGVWHSKQMKQFAIGQHVRTLASLAMSAMKVAERHLTGWELVRCSQAGFHRTQPGPLDAPPRGM